MPSLVISDTFGFLPFLLFQRAISPVPVSGAGSRCWTGSHQRKIGSRLLHGCQRSRLRPFCTNAPSVTFDLPMRPLIGGDFGCKLQIDPRSFNGSFRRSYRSIRLLRISQSLIVILLYRCTEYRAVSITIHRQLRDIELLRHGLSPITFRTVVCRLIGPQDQSDRERHTSFDVATFFEITLQDNPANPEDELLRSGRHWCDPEARL